MEAVLGVTYFTDIAFAQGTPSIRWGVGISEEIQSVKHCDDHRYARQRFGERLCRRSPRGSGTPAANRPRAAAKSAQQPQQS
jgi:hypothetical protein